MLVQTHSTYEYDCVGYRDRTPLDSIDTTGRASTGDVAAYSNLSVIQAQLDHEITARLKHCFYKNTSYINGAKSRYNTLTSIRSTLRSKSIDPEIGYTENTLTLNDLSTAITGITRACSNISAINTQAKSLSGENVYMKANTLDTPTLSSNEIMLADD